MRHIFRSGLGALLALGLSFSPQLAAESSCSRVLRAALVAPLRANDPNLLSEVSEALAIVNKSHFPYSRTLGEYARMLADGNWNPLDRATGRYGRRVLPESLGKSLAKLPPEAHVLDLGAGDLTAARQLLELGAGFGHELNATFGAPQYDDWTRAGELFERQGPPNITGVTMVELPSVPANARLQVLAQRYFEMIPDKDLVGRFGPVDLMIDVFGVLAYSLNLPQCLQKIARVLRSGGELWLRDNQVAIELKDGRILPLAEYIGQLPGFELVRVDHYYPASLIRRTDGAFARPRLRIEQLAAEMPPRVLYREY